MRGAGGGSAPTGVLFVISRLHSDGGTAVSPVDGTVWLPVPQVNGPQNKLFMLNPKTKQFKDYPLPPPLRLPHGIDFSTDGTLWFSAGSGHLAKLPRNPRARRQGGPFEKLGVPWLQGKRPS